MWHVEHCVPLHFRLARAPICGVVVTSCVQLSTKRSLPVHVRARWPNVPCSQLWREQDGVNKTNTPGMANHSRYHSVSITLAPSASTSNNSDNKNFFISILVAKSHAKIGLLTFPNPQFSCTQTIVEHHAIEVSSSSLTLLRFALCRSHTPHIGNAFRECFARTLSSGKMNYAWL